MSSIKYGVFSSVYGKYGIDEAARLIKEAGFDYVQFVPLLKGKWLSAYDVTPDLVAQIRSSYFRNGLELVGLSAGHRFFPPEKKAREAALSEAKRWIELAPEFGTKLIVTEFGSTHPEHNWTDHPDNYTKETWKEVERIYRELSEHAKKFGVTIGVEAHFAAVIKNAETQRRIIDSVGADNLKAVLDPANSITAENAENQSEFLEKSFELLGSDVVLAHAKDTRIVNGASDFVPAGRGVIPYRQYLELLNGNGYRGPLILEYLKEEDVSEVLNYLKGEQVPLFLQPLFKSDPELYDSAQGALDIVQKDEGALELKYRLLISIAADALQRHPSGAVACAREAIAAGATREQVVEVMRIVYDAGGLPALIENFDVYREVILK